MASLKSQRKVPKYSTEHHHFRCIVLRHLLGEILAQVKNSLRLSHLYLHNKKREDSVLSQGRQ